MRPYLDKVSPETWKAMLALTTTTVDAATELGLSLPEIELIKVRASQVNGCAFCLDLHSRRARDAGVTPQKLDLLPAWRESTLFTDREAAVLAVAEAATWLPLTEDAQADLDAARGVLGDDGFAAAEWVAVTINAANRISILSEHPVRPRDQQGALIR